MEEDRSIKDTGSTFEGAEPTTIIRAGDVGSAATSDGISRLMIVGVVLVISLLVAGLFLPPISLAQRLGFGGDADTVATGSGVTDGELALALRDGSDSVSVSAVAPTELGSDEATSGMAEALPADADFRSNIYLFNYADAAPQGSITIAAPQGGSTETVDLYGWNGTGWDFIPLQSTGATQWESAMAPLPAAVALVETPAPESVSVGAELLADQELPAAILPTLTEVAVGAMTLGPDGALQGEDARLVEGGYRQYLHVTNLGIVVDQVAVASLLEDSTSIAQHVDDLVAAAEGYAGLNLDYQGVAPEHRAPFSAFVADLAEALHANDQGLLVTLGAPSALDDGQWDTAGQDWQAIGRVADAVFVQLPLNPDAYGEEGLAGQQVAWAVTQIYRHKLSLLATTNAVDAVGAAFRELPNDQALEHFGELSLIEGGDVVQAGAPVEVGLAGEASPLEWDGESTMYRYTYEQAGQDHTVWLSNEAALSQRLQLAADYRLRGFAVRGLGKVVEGAGYAQAIESFVNEAEAPQPGGAAIVWTVEDEAEDVVASSSGEALSYRWEDTNQPGSYTISAVFAQGDAVAQLGSLNVNVDALATPTATPEPTAEATATEAAEAAAPIATATQAAPVAEIDPGGNDAVNNIASNFREGPGLGYRVIEVLPAGTGLTLLGRNAASDWYQVRVVSTEKEGWLYNNLLSINEGVDTNALEVVEVDPPTVGDDPAPPPPPPIANTGFELGGQTHTLANPTLMHEAGMDWVKFQHKWGPGDSPDAVAGRIGHAHGNGLKVLLSIPGAEAYPSSIDFNGYVEFLRGVAALGPDAIEIWNEMNIDFEWPAGQIDPNSYVNNMLKPAYQAIKSVNPNVMVISGAPAPTGYDNGTNAWADDRYMAGVAAAGGANYMDCIGVHHNAGATPPSATSGHPAGNNHYSWYFLPTLNMYYNSFGGSRPVCFTELGYLSGQDFGGVPSRFSWASGTTVSQHAQWLGEAVSLAGNSGKVRMVIVFNVDFTHWGDDPQAGFAMLRPDGSCPSCATLRAAMGR